MHVAKDHLQETMKDEKLSLVEGEASALSTDEMNHSPIYPDWP